MQAEAAAGQRDHLYAGVAGQAGTIGAVAQLGERLNGIQEVKGSNPFSSTRSGLISMVGRARQGQAWFEPAHTATAGEKEPFRP